MKPLASVLLAVMLVTCVVVTPAPTQPVPPSAAPVTPAPKQPTPLPASPAPPTQAPLAPPPPSGEGPYYHQVLSATSSDGLNWMPDNRVLIDHASVPAAILTPDGKIRLYYVDASRVGPGRPENVNCAESSDGGATFQVLNCTIANRAGDKAVDPSVVLLPDGRYRMYYYAVTGQIDESAHSIYSAISNDGIHFTQEKAVFTYNGLVDPDVFWTGQTWLMYVFSLKDKTTVVARSQDGLSFEYGGPSRIGNWGTAAPTRLADGRLRLYAFDQPAMRQIASFISTDGLNWTQEPGVRLVAPAGRQITDPFVVRLPNGAWKMFFKVSVMKSGGPVRLPPGTPSGPPSGVAILPVPASGNRPCLPTNKIISIQDPNGPSFHQVAIARSTDGLVWQTDARIIIDRASVPEGVRLADGRWVIYAVDGSGLGGPGLVYAESKDDGKTWTCGKVNVPGADPDVVMLPDGRLRLYYVEFPTATGQPMPQPDKPNRVRSALSSDGKNFTVEEGIRIEGVNYTDPDVIRVGNEWFMYISTGTTAWAARSSDGLKFDLAGKANESGAVSGSYVFPDGTLRHYFCSRGGILSGISTDGASPWKQEAGCRIEQNPNWRIVCDPSILSDSQGGYWMVFKVLPR